MTLLSTTMTPVLKEPCDEVVLLPLNKLTDEQREDGSGQYEQQQ